MQKTISLFFLLISSLYCYSNTGFNNKIDSVVINDGPYIFIKDSILIEKNIINNKVITSKLPISSKKINFKPEHSSYTGVKKIAALSDIHGQYDIAIKVLKNNKVIDKNLNWSFGKGHLVIVGDIFDRGDKVTETLWFIYKLEEQAQKSGGKVHYLLGNHEYMVLHNDLRYLHTKYIKSSKLLAIPFPKLIDKNTILGRWLRSKSTIITINDKLFVHGGISKEFISNGFNIDDTNRLMRESIDRKKEEMKTVPFYKKYYGTNGPIWYRGYFKEGFNEHELNNLLRQLNVNHIIVGHTSQNEVMQLFDKKIIVVDSSIKNGKYGEILIIKNNKFIRKTIEGCKANFNR